MKLALGTVQFGLKYGIHNVIGIPDDTDLKKIFEIAQNEGINTFDTALSYGDAEIKLSKFISPNSKVISKFPLVESKDAMSKNLQSSLERLGISILYGYMAHNADMLYKNPDLWQYLLDAKSFGFIKKIGYSLYTVEQLEKLLNLKMIPDIVQLPYSLLDRKFENYFSQLKELGTEIHVRSVFLQGLYFINLEALPPKLAPLQASLVKLVALANKHGVAMANMALNFVVQHPKIDKVVIGVDSSTQLAQNINFVKEWKTNLFLFEQINSIHVIKPELLNPANW